MVDANPVTKEKDCLLLFNNRCKKCSKCLDLELTIDNIISTIDSIMQRKKAIDSIMQRKKG